jgi:hypothetical protein
LSGSEIDLLNEHVDAIYVTVLPHIAAKLSECFRGSVIFRPFGHGYLQTYSEIAKNYGVVDLDVIRAQDNFIWCPILSALQEVEHAGLWKTPVLLGGFVSPERIGGRRWKAEHSTPVVLETIPRLGNKYYRKIYDEFVREFGSLPLQILGNNLPKGGELEDPRVVGHLSDADYYDHIASARVSIYHGDSPYHLHYHPLEFAAAGVPVLFHVTSAIAMEARDRDVSETELSEMGMYRNADEARLLAELALKDVSFALELSERQRYFTDDLFSRQRALHQAQWLRSVCTSQINHLRKGSEAKTDRRRAA